MRKNFAIETEPKLAITYTSASATTNGTSLDTATIFKGNPEDIGFTAIAYALGGGTVSFKVQDSADNSSWADVTGLASQTVTANVPVTLSAGTARLRRYVRLVAVLAGATNATFAAFAHGFALGQTPPNGFGAANFTVLGQ